ncbi:acetyltransferase, GNAT family [Dendrothele bispora CBS 962.96]|uniref:Acetyltransferase, GNAT family n=1 Tax=Dendrothele bispora (strain CBS 962.96) TaxID=1314807 RepID=A0A4S8MIT2_DENBC|nr:acetyltransferase, GNAT family [Dendrothele bispora CBS 962.96]
MSKSSVTISVCPPSSFYAEIPELAILLKETVEENVTLNFCLPFSTADAEAWWGELKAGLKTGREILILAHASETPRSENSEKAKEGSLSEHGRKLVGCVILYLSQKTNAPHRGEIGKLLVKKEERGSGIGRLLMECVEEQARKHGRWILYLDTQTGSPAEKFYEKNGWTRIGVFPDVVYVPDKSSLSDTTFFYKRVKADKGVSEEQRTGQH